MGEFDLIRQYFAPLSLKESGAFNLTDDAAVIDVPPRQKIVVTADALIEGVHFFAEDQGDHIAAKLLGVNLSDLAAMGANAKFYTLTIAIPKDWNNLHINNWLEMFSDGLNETQDAFDVTLIGGDTVSTSGPMALSLTAFGLVDEGQELRRNGALPGDKIWVTGAIGDAALGLKLLTEELNISDPTDGDYLIDRYRRPQPRLRVGVKLIDIATAAIDISDGLAADLTHVCQESDVGANVMVNNVPLSDAARALIASNPDLITTILSGGDDYELLFTANPNSEEKILRISEQVQCPITEIGVITGQKAIRIYDINSKEIDLQTVGFTHF